MFYEGRIYLENVNVYKDMVGSDIASALSSTTKGNDERIGDVEFSNFEFSVVQFCAYFSETDGMTCQLESNKLVMAYETRLAQKR